VNGKDYVIGAMELVERLVSEIGSSGLLDGDLLLDETAKAGSDLGNLKNKATLRTRNGANIAFPVYDAAQQLEEAWEEARETEDPDELKEQMETFASSVKALIATLKDRTVIMT
jgi:hypothetical protein